MTATDDTDSLTEHGYSLGYTSADAPSICMTSTLVPAGMTRVSS